MTADTVTPLPGVGDGNRRRRRVGEIQHPPLPGDPWCAEPGNDPNQWDEETLDSETVREARSTGDNADAWLEWSRNRARTLCAPCRRDVREACLARGVREIREGEGLWRTGIWGGLIHEDVAAIARGVKDRPRKDRPAS